MRLFAASLVTALVVATVHYRLPVDAPVVDRFRPPSAPWAPGNRGIDFATNPGTPVRAAADGRVTFAGAVGGRLHVVLLHADGIRTSYSFLRSIVVRPGDPVESGALVGTAGERVHFGARVGERYIDPSLLFERSGPARVHLVPDRPAPARLPTDRGVLERLVAPVSRAPAAASP